MFSSLEYIKQTIHGYLSQGCEMCNRDQENQNHLFVLVEIPNPSSNGCGDLHMRKKVRGDVLLERFTVLRHMVGLLLQLMALIEAGLG